MTTKITLIEMKKHTNKLPSYCIITFIVWILAGSCEKNIEYNLLSGDLVGKVLLYDNENNQIEDNSNIEIIFEGRTQNKTITDINGQFNFSGLESGTYNITINKSGYYQFKYNGYRFVGGNLPTYLNQINLYELTNSLIDNLEVSIFDKTKNIVMELEANVSNTNNNTISRFRCFLHTEPNVSYNNYISTISASSYPNNMKLSTYTQIDTLKFPIGSPLYFVIYPAANGQPQWYMDTNTGINIYTNIETSKPSNITSITIPETEINLWTSY